MSRRAILRGMAGIAAAAAAKVSPPTPRNTFNSLGHGIAGQMSVPMNCPSESQWNRFHKLMEPHYRRRERLHRVVDLCGGWPPSVASMHASAPWFRAHMAVRWTEKHLEETTAAERMFRKLVFGEES